MNDEERRQWVQNDEGLYHWFKRSRKGLYKFVEENRDEIDAALKRMGVKLEPHRMKKRAHGMTGRAGQSLRP